MKKTIITIMAMACLMTACSTGETKTEVSTTDSTAVKCDSLACDTACAAPVKADTTQKTATEVK